MIWKRCILTKLLIVTGFVGAFATYPIPDKLVYNGKNFSVYLNILPDEFYKIDTVTFDSLEYINRILTVDLFGDKKGCQTTACVDFLASWEIEKNQLYLTGIYSCCYYEDSIKADLTSLFKEKVINGKVKADWVSSKEIVQGGEELNFISYDIPVFKKEIEFEFLEGKLLNINTFDNSKSRQSVYSQNAEKLLNFIYTNIDWDNLPKQKKPIRVITRFSANENGKIDDIEVTKKSENEIFNQEAIRVIKSIPDWDVIYVKGQLYRQYYSMPILFSEENRKKYGQ